MIENILSNRYTQIATLLAVPLAFLADYSQNVYAYLIAAFIVFGLFGIAYRDEKRLQNLYMQPDIPIPIIFNIANPADARNALRALFMILDRTYPNHKKNLEKYFNIVERDLLFKYDGDIFDEARLIDFLKITKHDIKKLQTQTPYNVQYHIIYIGPIASAILVGTLLSTEGVTLYQYNKSSDSYNIALQIEGRTHKEPVASLQLIKEEKIGEIGKRVTVAIDLASHKIALAKLPKPIVHLESTFGATLKKPEDFILANREIYSCINTLQQTCDHITLVYSMPTTVAILLGMSLQNYWDIELTQYADGEYKRVVEHLNAIRYYF